MMLFVDVLEKGTEYSIMPTILWSGYATDEEIRQFKKDGFVVVNSFGGEI